jgi:hypothetical protein
MYKVIVKTKERALYITKILAISKDGYEKEISRVESKRNLFKFIKTYLVKETNFVSNPEEYWLKRKVYHKRKDIEESLQHFILNTAPINEQEEFAYEGIFDQKKDISPLKLKGSRMDLSNFINPLNRSKMVDDDLQFKPNSGNIIHLQEDISNNSISPNSANSNAFGRRMKRDIKNDVSSRMPAVISGSFHDYTIPKRKVASPQKKGKFEKHRSHKQIQISRLQTRKGSENLERNMANKLVNEVNQEKHLANYAK